MSFTGAISLVQHRIVMDADAVEAVAVPREYLANPMRNIKDMAHYNESRSVFRQKVPEPLP